MENQAVKKYLNRRQVCEMCGFSDSTRHRLEAAGEFPRRRRLSRSRVGWDLAEIEAFLTSREFA